MPIELISTGAISPPISLDALVLPPRSYDALVMPLHRAPSGMVSNNEVISATWTYGINDTPPVTATPPSTTPPSTTPPLVPDKLVVVSPTPDLPQGDWEAKEQADRDFLLHSDLLGEVSTEGTPPDTFHDDGTVGSVMSLESAHTDQEIFKPSGQPKNSGNHVIDKMAAVMANWEEQVNKATSQVQSLPDLAIGLGRLPLTRVHDTLQGISQVSANASQAPASQPVQNSATVNMMLQNQIALQKMAEATSSFMHALDAGEVSMKLIGSPDPFVPLAPPAHFYAKML